MTRQFIEGEVADQRVLDVLDRIVSLGGNTAPAMRKIAGFMENQVILGFKRSTSPYGDTWAPIHHREGQPLIDNRILLGSITGDFGDDYAEVGTNVEYAAIHQFGGRTGRNRAAEVTARPYLPIEGTEVVLPEFWQQEILGILQTELEGLING